MGSRLHRFRFTRARPRWGLIGAGVLGVALAWGGLPAAADTAPTDPTDPRTPVTVSADGLPTVQIDGVVWRQLILGGTVYAVGKFTRARPAGAAPGTSTVVRNHILAYDLATGVLKTGFRPSLNAQAHAVTASPDGSVLYVAGDFTQVDGATANRVVALNPVTGARISSFKVSANASVRAVVARGSTVWLAGNFSTLNGTSRMRLGAVRASDGAVLAWAPRADRRVNAMVMSPDGTKIVVGGAFTTLNGSSRPGYGLGALSSSSGALLPMPTNDVVRNGGTEAAITSLAGDASYVYGTGYVYGSGGRLEGAFASRWSDLGLHWLEDCHGDSYGVFPSPTAVYVVGHPHTCRNIGGWPEMSPRIWQRAVAFSRAATGTVGRETSRSYYNFQGNPAPSLLVWFPTFNTGSVTGQSQGPWTVEGNGTYVVVGGEFTRVNNVPQQGLVRFAIRAVAPNKQGPRLFNADFTPTLSLTSTPGQVRVSWPSNWDRDNQNLTYRVFRDGSTTARTTRTSPSTFWQRPVLSFTDTSVPRGTRTYTVRVTDPLGNSVTSPKVTISVP